MRIRNLMSALQKLIDEGVSPETEVSMFTGWEGETFLTPQDVTFLPSGIDPERRTRRSTDHQPIVLIYRGVPDCVSRQVKP